MGTDYLGQVFSILVSLICSAGMKAGGIVDGQFPPFFLLAVVGPSTDYSNGLGPLPVVPPDINSHLFSRGGITFLLSLGLNLRVVKEG